MSNRARWKLSTVLVFGLGLVALGLFSCGGAANSAAPLPPSPPSVPSSSPAPPSASGAAMIDMVTYHNDNARTGQNLSETVLTPANVNAGTFGKIAFLAVDGKVDGQPLYLANLSTAGGTHNVVFAVTEHDSVFAFDADNGSLLWQGSVLGSGETPSDDHNCSQVTPEIGITSTPVIDRQRGPHGAIYVVAISKDSSGGYHHRIHALDVTTGAELFGGPTEIQASYPGNGVEGSGGRDVFDPKLHYDRVGLLMLNNVIYTGWTSHCDVGAYTGWLIGYDAATLRQSSVLNVTPNGSDGSLWMSGAGLAADAAGNIYFLDANGTFDTQLDAAGFPTQRDFGNSFLKISTANGLAVSDYFAPFNTVQESSADADLGAGGALLLPDITDGSGQARHLAVGAGKDAHIYVVDRDAMGKFSPDRNNNYQDIAGALSGGVFSMPAFFNRTVYYGAVGDHIKAFPVVNARLATQAAAQTPNAFVYPGVTPAVSANGTSNAILWAVENSNPAVLHAYNAANLSQELYNSNQAGTRDNFGPGNKFITPTIVNGKVFVGTTNGVAVFGLLH